jgi:hypothetical protein
MGRNFVSEYRPSAAMSPGVRARGASGGRAAPILKQAGLLGGRTEEVGQFEFEFS